MYCHKKMVKILKCYLIPKKSYGTLSKGAIFFGQPCILPLCTLFEKKYLVIFKTYFSTNFKKTLCFTASRKISNRSFSSTLDSLSSRIAVVLIIFVNSSEITSFAYLN